MCDVSQIQYFQERMAGLLPPAKRDTGEIGEKGSPFIKVSEQSFSTREIDYTKYMFQNTFHPVTPWRRCSKAAQVHKMTASTISEFAPSRSPVTPPTLARHQRPKAHVIHKRSKMPYVGGNVGRQYVGRRPQAEGETTLQSSMLS